MNDEELIEQMVGRLGEELKRILEQVESGRVPATALEGILREQLWHVGAQALGVMLEALDGQLSAGAGVHDYRTRTLMSLFGALDVTRARCRQAPGWRYPLDEALGLMGHRRWTVGVQEAVSLLSCECAFATASELMGRLLGVPISAKTVQEVAETSGRRAAEMLEEAVVGSSASAASALVPPGTPAADTLIIPVDGCQAPQRDGWHEVKVATLYAKEARYQDASGRGKLGSKSYFATLEAAEAFGWALRACAGGWGLEQVRRLVVMGDGAAWIWNLSDLQFPGAVEIVDFYHAVEHLWQVGEALWGDRTVSVATRSWVRHYRKRLKQGRVDLVVAAILRSRQQRGRRLSAQQAKQVRLDLAYFRRNAQRMRYGRFRQMGLPIGTGAVEGSCKFVVQSRFKHPGSRWSRPGLRSMLALKLLRLNQRWSLLWPHLEAA